MDLNSVIAIDLPCLPDLRPYGERSPQNLEGGSAVGKRGEDDAAFLDPALVRPLVYTISPPACPSITRTFMRRSPSEKYVSIWRYDPSCPPPASRARAVPRSSYQAFSSTRCFEPLPTTSGIPCACKKLPSRRQRGNPAPCLSPKTEMGGDRKADDRMTRSSMSSRRAGRTAAHAIATLVGLLLVVPGLYIASARDPRSGDAFEYDHNIYLDRGTGEYDGYSETTRAHSTYRVLSTSGDNSTVLAPGSWSWQASDGNRQSGMLDVQFS